MSDPRPSRRFALLLMVTVIIGITNCTPAYYARKDPKTLCDRGNGSPSRPLICVDEATKLTSPEKAQVFDVEPEPDKSGDMRRSERPVTIHWLARRGGNLGIEFSDKSCVEKARCDGAGHCWTRVKIRLAKGDKPVECKYTLNLDGKTVDPPVIVNPCCWLAVPEPTVLPKE